VTKTSSSLTIGSQLLDEDLLQGLAIPGHPAMSPLAVRGRGTRHAVETVERGRERGGRGTACVINFCTKKNTRKRLLYLRHGMICTYSSMLTLLNTRGI